VSRERSERRAAEPTGVVPGAAVSRERSERRAAEPTGVVPGAAVSRERSERRAAEPTGVVPDGSRLEAAEAGVAHERAEADHGAPTRGHVTAADVLDAESLPATGAAASANDDVVVGDRPSGAGFLIVAAVGVVVVVSLVLFALALA
jgi:hypothetical protein